MVIGDFLWPWLVLRQKCFRLVWLYAGDRDATSTHLGASHNWELMYMLRVVIGSGDVPARRATLQAILPKCDAKGILECVSERAPRLVQIPGDYSDEARRESGTAQALGAVAAGGAINP
ncbi:hypothetical protein E2562_023995 [Oryza meyeriana var. granulata]|uniref:Uncharacterized protein n=1 Tax=Oryza meyeriana var. granulata TaxID=110450 RepID=A0A6G1EDM6_9ORYZ|nr:hypothetical protein E2562_023995 [Oryza meyeriana var. granulata]